MTNETNALKEIMQWIEVNDCRSLLITTTANTENEEWQNVLRKQKYRKVLSAYIKSRNRAQSSKGIQAKTDMTLFPSRRSKKEQSFD